MGMAILTALVPSKGSPRAGALLDVSCVQYFTLVSQQYFVGDTITTLL